MLLFWESYRIEGVGRDKDSCEVDHAKIGTRTSLLDGVTSLRICYSLDLLIIIIFNIMTTIFQNMHYDKTINHLQFRETIIKTAQEWENSIFELILNVMCAKIRWLMSKSINKFGNMEYGKISIIIKKILLSDFSNLFIINCLTKWRTHFLVS